MLAVSLRVKRLYLSPDSFTFGLRAVAFFGAIIKREVIWPPGYFAPFLLTPV